MSFGEGNLHEQVKQLKAELEAERAKKRYEYVVDGKCESCTERKGYYIDAETIQGQQEHIAELEREFALANLKASEDFKPRCDVCDRATLLVQIEALESLVRDLYAELTMPQWDKVIRAIDDDYTPTDFKNRMDELGLMEVD